MATTTPKLNNRERIAAVLGQDMRARVAGMKEVKAALKLLEDETERKRLGMALKGEYRRAAEVVAERGRGLSPVVSGRLRSGIRPKGLAGGAKVEVPARIAPYANAIHWGWPSRPDKRKKWRGGPIPANPFLWRAAEQRAGEVWSIMRGGVTRILDEVEKVGRADG